MRTAMVNRINRAIDTAQARAGMSDTELLRYLDIQKSTYYSRRKDGDWKLRTLRQMDAAVRFTAEEKGVIF